MIKCSYFRIHLNKYSKTLLLPNMHFKSKNSTKVKIRTISFFLLTALMISSCKNKNNKQVILSQPTSIHLNNLSSASGIGIHNNTIYIVGDDAPWLYTLDNNLTIINKIKVSDIDTLFRGRTPKFIKADFEGAEIISDGNTFEIVIISSGSSRHTRDTAHIINISSGGKQYSKTLRPLYEKIKLAVNLPVTNEINIEGIAFSEEYAYLVHRGNVSENLLIEINRNEFIDFIKETRSIPDFNIYHYFLPMLNGVSSGFSGICIKPDKSGLLFTASMEDTNDEINDGKVLGSFVGIIPFAGMAKGEFTASLLLNNDQLLEKKLEGISVISSNKKGEMQIMTVCDNDDGTSDIITFNMEER